MKSLDGRIYFMRLILISIMLLALIACGIKPSATPSEIPTKIPISTPLPSQTQTTIPTNTPSPTQTSIPPLSGSGGGVLAYTLGPAAGNMQIHEINLDGSDDRKLIDTTHGVNHADWSPDGSRIVAVKYMDNNFTTWSLFVFNADGSNPIRLTQQQGAADSEPAWSPDGTRVLFSRIQFITSTDYRSDLWMVNADGSDPHMVVSDGFAGKWSPDGTRLIYSSPESGNYELYTSNPDGSGSQRLTNTASHESYPAWSPDGKKILFLSSEGEWNSSASISTYEIYVMNSDGTNLCRLTDNKAFDGNPRWSPDGTLIAFSSDIADPEHYDVFIMNADGTNIRQVTHVPAGARAINPIWRP